MPPPGEYMLVGQPIGERLAAPALELGQHHACGHVEHARCTEKRQPCRSLDGAFLADTLRQREDEVPVCAASWPPAARITLAAPDGRGAGVVVQFAERDRPQRLRLQPLLVLLACLPLRLRGCLLLGLELATVAGPVSGRCRKTSVPSSARVNARMLSVVSAAPV